MDTLRNVGAAAPGPVTPGSDNARRQPGVEGNRAADNSDCAAKQIATATARAALLGIELHPIGARAWLLRHAFGVDLGIASGLPALADAIAAVEAARAQVRELLQRMRGGHVHVRFEDAILHANPTGAPPEISNKDFETFRARAALAGYQLAVGDRAGEFLISRWGLDRTLVGLLEVGKFLDRVGG